MVDEQGGEVEGVQVWEGEDQEVCGVRIVLCSEVKIVLRGDPWVRNISLKDHRGRWLVKTQLADGRQLALSLETEDDVGRPIVQLSNFFQVSEGLRLPQDFEPLSYDIGLVPELFPSTSTHKQRSLTLKGALALVQVPGNLIDGAEGCCDPAQSHLPQRRAGNQPGKHLDHKDGQPAAAFFAAGNCPRLPENFCDADPWCR